MAASQCHDEKQPRNALVFASRGERVREKRLGRSKSRGIAFFRTAMRFRNCGSLYGHNGDPRARVTLLSRSAYRPDNVSWPSLLVNVQIFAGNLYPSAPTLGLVKRSDQCSSLLCRNNRGSLRQLRIGDHLLDGLFFYCVSMLLVRPLLEILPLVDTRVDRGLS